MTEKLFQINPKDNVAVDLGTGAKYALTDIAAGGDVIKYGMPIGAAKADIARGSHVHTQNLKSKLAGGGDYSDIQVSGKRTELSPTGLKFDGYVRKSGGVGIRNEIFIIPTVGCVNNLCSRIASTAARETGAENVRAFEHPYGCSQLGGDHEATKHILRNLALHRNAGGVLIVALGCENNTLEEFKESLGVYDAERIRFLRAQDEADEIGLGVQTVKELLALAAEDKRSPAGIENLTIGLKCGGSDGLSGITANPLLGRVSERLVSEGASVILTEVPEMFGAEHILMQNAKDEQIKEKIEKLIIDFKQYYIDNGESVSENPSPGNKEGGISTLEEKSLGCTQKCGDCMVNGVINYGERAGEKGLSILEGPGNDIVAVSALAAAGAHMILFTTGRGTPLGAPVPVIKVSTNTALYEKKPNWIDFDAEVLLSSGSSAALELFDLVLQTASGKPTKSEKGGYFDFAIWKRGVTL